MGTGFVLAALVPSKKEGSTTIMWHYPGVIYGVLFNATGGAGAITGIGAGVGA